MLGPEGIPDIVYLTIYNGTGRDVAVSDIAVGGYCAATLVRRTSGFTGFDETAVWDAYLVIPRKAELDMGKGTVFTSLDREAGLPRNVTTTIVFNDSSAAGDPWIRRQRDQPTMARRNLSEVEKAQS